MAIEDSGPSRVAVIDTGTNSTRLIVASVAGERVEELGRKTTVTRLGERVDETGALSESAMRRVRDCVKKYADVISKLGAERTVILATSSVRDAANGPGFIAGLAGEFSFEHRVLAGGEEAALSFRGATAETRQSIRAMLLDVGGGSTEIAAGSHETAGYFRSLRLDCVRLSERYLHHDPATHAELSAAADHVDEVLAAGIDRQLLGKVENVLAVAGTATALAAIDLGQKVYDRSRVHNHRLTRERVDDWLSRLAAMTAAERMRRFPTMETGRADVIVGGVLIISRVLKFTGVRQFTVSERDILDGAAAALAAGELV